MSTTIALGAAWDFTVDAGRNFASLSTQPALAQDVASMLRLFLGELWYDTTQGVPYFGDVLGKPVAKAYLESLLSDAALTVPGVVLAKATITSVSNRGVAGMVKITDAAGIENSITF